MACHTEGWLECRQAALAGRTCLRRLAPGSACRQEGKNFLARTVYWYWWMYWNSIKLIWLIFMGTHIKQLICTNFIFATNVSLWHFHQYKKWCKEQWVKFWGVFGFINLEGLSWQFLFWLDHCTLLKLSICGSLCPLSASKYWMSWNGHTFTLSQWYSSGNPVCLELRPSLHWNATEERIVGSQCVSSALPVFFQWLSSGVPVFQLCKLTLDRH